MVTAKKSSRAVAILLTLAMVVSCFAFIGAKSANAASAKKDPYQDGDRIKDAVFYIGVDADGDGSITGAGDAVYYYSMAEIKAAGDEVAYHYGNHGEGETATVKGAKLDTLIKNTTGITYDDSWTCQYLEEDAYHATGATYQDTIQGLTDENGVGNGSGAGVAAETIIGYTAKTTYDVPDENNVDEKVFTDFVNYDREPSNVRVYRQTSSANSSIMKMLKGVVITPDPTVITGENGYTVKSLSDDATQQIADDYEVLGFVEGMKWPATPNVNIPWAALSNNQAERYNGLSQIITIGSGSAQSVKYYYDETPFFKVTKNGKTTTTTRSAIKDQSVTFPKTDTYGETKYTYYGYNKPMYVRYEGVDLTTLVGTVPAGNSVYLVTKDNKKIDITAKMDNYFVAVYYTQSKKSTNISNGKRVPLNYSYSVIVDTTSAPIEYSNDDVDYTTASGKTPTEYANAKIVVDVAAPAKTTLSKVAKSGTVKKGKGAIKVSWKAVSGAKGYQVVYGTNSKITKGKKTVTVKSSTAKSKTIKNLKKGQKYYVKVRAYKVVNGKTYYGAYSAIKSVKR